MTMKNQVRWIYRAILKDSGNVINISDHVVYYDRYIKLRTDVLNDGDSPSRLRVTLPPIDMPKYLKWIKKYIEQIDKE